MDENAVGPLATSIEDFNSVFIRLPSQGQLSFSSLSVLHTLSRRGPSRLSDLVESEQIKQPALTAAAAKLERDGLITRHPDPADGRATLISLSSAGAAIVAQRRKGRVERLEQLVARLTSAEQAQLLSIGPVLDEVVRLSHTATLEEEE
ncbi:MarR family winged helix-turn-helix transcriptional regulator [Tessaracoccus antarcticus]|uniref:MarR family transcriptional regulator n=1 Tax=Tessaracoccus antarcticus TaxID=2479848 RepID=A0A3M0FZI0_9ACTN|nr:MarR family transcriptional regulator [Tessaracoccus antarcticus]RMB57828.1 MarR family transcriptional regulator [Tessaracoccus antarcticus]